MGSGRFNVRFVDSGFQLGIGLENEDGSRDSVRIRGVRDCMSDEDRMKLDAAVDDNWKDK